VGFDFFRKAGKIIGIKSLSGGRDSVVDEFFAEVAHYQQALTQSYAGTLGKERAARVARLDKDLLPADSYLFKSSQLSADFMPAGFSVAENLLFFVGADLEEKAEFEIDSTGCIQGNLKVLETFPVFLLSPKVIGEYAGKLEKTSLPPYLTLWLHEYSHFIGYCLQRRPLGAAHAMLYGALAGRGYEGLSVYDIEKIMRGNEEWILRSLAETIMYLHWLDEDMANFLQELILKDLGFDPISYFGEAVNERPFYPQFKKWKKERYMSYLEDWNNANFVVPEFMKNFLRSFNRVQIKRNSMGAGLKI